MTDDGILGGLQSPALIVTYRQPTKAASGVILDLDFDEIFTIEAKDADGKVLTSVTIRAGDPRTGDGIATPRSVVRKSADIHSIRLKGTRRASGSFGLAFDNFDAHSAPCGGLEATVAGSESDGVLVGTEATGVIVGHGGNDILYGLGGNDVICGGQGDDIVLGGGGKDKLFGDTGDDVLHGDAGDDGLDGGPGRDALFGDDGDDRISGNASNDYLNGGDGDDRLTGGTGRDVCDGSGENTADDTNSTCDAVYNVP